MYNPVPKVAAIHDLSGFGRTSLTVVIPILSSLGIQVCPLPTAILSTHTVEYTDFSLLDLTSEMANILTHWEKLNLKFDGIYSGFMASEHQMALVARCIKSCLKQGGLAVVDPVLGDNGILDPTMTPEMVIKMRELVAFAQIITPNFTEAALLLDRPWQDHIDLASIKIWLQELSKLGPKTIVITSVPLQGMQDQNTSVLAYEQDSHRFWRLDCSYIPAHYPGTGDTLASVLTGSLLNGDSLPIALEKAVQFVTLGIRATFGHGLPTREGILLERILPSLQMPMVNCQASII